MQKYSIREKYRMLRSRIAIVVEDIFGDVHCRTKIPINKRISLLMKGFYGFSYLLYDLDNNDIKYYLSEFQRRKTRFINGRYSYILGDKLIFDQIVRQYCKTARIFSIILHGIMYPLCDKIPIGDINSLISYLETKGPLVLKPNTGTDSGKGIMLIKMKSKKVIINNKSIKLDELKELIRSLHQYIVCEFIRQGKYGDKLYSETVNSIRILTMMSPKDNEPFIAGAVQKVGTSISKPLDHWEKGGLSAQIDIDTGILSRAFSIRNGQIRYYDKHPDSGAKIEGIEIPNWKRIKEQTLNLATKLPYLTYVGWDIVPLDDDILVLEANNCSGVAFLQSNEPLLKDEKVREFYKYHEIIK